MARVAGVCLFAFPRSNLFTGFARGLLHLDLKLVCDIILVDVAHIRGGLHANLLSGHDLNVVEPLVGVKSAPDRFLSHFEMFPGPAL